MRLEGYRRDIDGLRAIAVMAVVLYHAGFGVPGGYVGVDVFFAISGYLITSIILREIDEGRFTLRGFWMRRVRRILPAAAVVVVFTLAVAATFMLPRDFEELAKSAVAQTFAMSNFYFWQDTGYFAGAAEVKPLLHTWSLAVEEQFYLLLPLTLLWLSRRRRRITCGALATVAVLSLAWSLFEVRAAPSRAFFLLPSRAWELLAGSLVAFLPALSGKPARQGVTEALAWIGLVLILVPCFIFTSATPFPGAAALPPVLGTCLVMFAKGHGETTVSRLLGCRVMVGLGLISYSLYLWHWPLFAFARYWFFPLSPWMAAGLVIASIALAAFSYRFVETPFRRRTPTCTDRWVLKRAVAAQLVILALAITIDQKDGFHSRLSGELLEMSEGNQWADVTDEQVAEGNFRTLGVDDASVAPSFILWGDSHAKVTARLLSDLASERGLRGVAATSNFGRANLVARPEDESLRERNKLIETFIVESGIRHVLIVQRWERAFGYRSPADREFPRYSREEKESMDQILPALAARLGEAGCRVYILDQIPRQEGDDLLRAELFRSVMLGLADAVSNKKTLADYNAEAFWRPYLENCLSAPGVQVLDVRPHVFDSEGRTRVFVDGKSCYRDDNHLSNHGARVFLTPLFLPIFEAVERENSKTGE